MKTIVGIAALGLPVVLGGCPSLTPANSATVAACVPTVLQDAQNLHQLAGGLAAISAAPVTVMPPPVMTQPPPVVVTPTPSGPVITPAPPPAVGPDGGPVVTPSARLPRRRVGHTSDRQGEPEAKARVIDLQTLFGPDGHLKRSVAVGL